MYEFLSGRLASRRPGVAVVEAGGVGYRVLIPLSTFERLPTREGAAVKLLLHHYLREDRESLFGFATEEEREYFVLLNEVTGVGPALALSIVSALPFGTFRSAVLSGDAATVTRVKGVGKKLAARLILEMADPLKNMGPPVSAGRVPVGAAADAALALVALGYDRREADARAAEAAGDLGPGAEPGELVREVLRRGGER